MSRAPFDGWQAARAELSPLLLLSFPQSDCSRLCDCWAALKTPLTSNWSPVPPQRSRRAGRKVQQLWPMSTLYRQPMALQSMMMRRQTLRRRRRTATMGTSFISASARCLTIGVQLVSTAPRRTSSPNVSKWLVSWQIGCTPISTSEVSSSCPLPAISRLHPAAPSCFYFILLPSLACRLARSVKAFMCN